MSSNCDSSKHKQPQTVAAGVPAATAGYKTGTYAAPGMVFSDADHKRVYLAWRGKLIAISVECTETCSTAVKGSPPY